MTAGLARLLPDFQMGDRPPLTVAQHPEPPAPPAQPAIDLDAERAAARAEGEAAARARLEQQHATEREAEQARHAAEIAAVRAELETMAAQTIPAAIEARAAGLADAIAGDVAEVLTPLVDEAVRERILAGLAAEIRGALELETAGGITLSGPQELVAALRDRLGPDADRITIQPSGGVDIEVEVDRTRLAARLSDWGKALRECLA